MCIRNSKIFLESIVFYAGMTVAVPLASAYVIFMGFMIADTVNASDRNIGDMGSDLIKVYWLDIVLSLLIYLSIIVLLVVYHCAKPHNQSYFAKIIALIHTGGIIYKIVITCIMGTMMHEYVITLGSDALYSYGIPMLAVPWILHVVGITCWGIHYKE